MHAQSGKSVQVLLQPVLRIGLLRVPGVGAYLLRFAAFGLLTALAAYTQPHWGTVATDASWLAFSIYWGLAV
ncbi:MAG TPA: hypothetical protein VKB26_01030 [Candidatus Acidoferrales bacterium]|nr:hypothetical protein [Candidatus Acidoferrales bacterium]